MTDFATLVLAADSRGLVSGEQALDKLASTAERTENRTGKALDKVGKSAQEVGKQSIYASQQSRMMAMQLSQVAQQASATGNWIQAIAIQLPDLALGFGPIGIAAGVAAGALLPLVANMVTSQEEAESLAESVKSLRAATEAYDKAVNDATQSADDLVAKFGNQAEAAQKVFEVLRRLQELKWAAALKEQQDAISTSLTDLTWSLGQLQSAAQLPRNQMLDEIKEQTGALAQEFGLTVTQAERLKSALDGINSAVGPTEFANAARTLSDEIDKAASEGAKIPPSLRETQRLTLEAARDALRFGNLLGTANGQAAALETTMSGVADQAGRAAQSIAAALDAKNTAALVNQLGPLNTLNGFNRTPFQDEMEIQNERARNTKSQYQIEQERLARRGRRGGGRKSGFERGLDEDHREATRLWEETRTAAEKYEKELDRINNLHERGFIDTDTYSRAIENLKEDYWEASEAGKFFSDISDDLKEGILDAIVEGKNLGDVFEDLAKKIAKAALEAALFNTGPFASGGGKGGGGLLGGLFSFLPKLFSFDGGGYTGDGSRSGGMDGKGGYLAMLHPQESVIDHTKGGAANSNVQVSVVSRFDADGNFETKVEGISSRVSDRRTAAAIGQYDANLPGRINDVMERTG